MSNAEILLHHLIFGISLLAVGVMLWMAVRHVIWFRQNHLLWHIWMILVLLGTAGVVALVAELIYPAPGIDVSWRSIGYMVCLAMIAIGVIGAGITLPWGGRPKKGEIL